MATGKTSRQHPFPTFLPMAALPLSATTRIHVSPLDPSTAPILLPPTLVSPEYLARISYHTLAAFPEKPFGYLTVAHDTAERIRKRLHGVTFRGMKVHVEPARPEKRRCTGNDVEDAVTDEQQVRKRAKKGRKEHKEEEKRKRSEGVLSGVELKDRKVERGWTGKKGDREREALVKITVPVNRLGEGTKSQETKGEKRATGKCGKRTKPVKEFERSTKFPSFLKTASLPDGGARTTEYVDGVGWVDSNGRVVEETKDKKVLEPGLLTLAVPDRTDVTTQPPRKGKNHGRTVYFSDGFDVAGDSPPFSTSAIVYHSDSDEDEHYGKKRTEEEQPATEGNKMPLDADKLARESSAGPSSSEVGNENQESASGTVQPAEAVPSVGSSSSSGLSSSSSSSTSAENGYTDEDGDEPVPVQDEGEPSSIPSNTLGLYSDPSTFSPTVLPSVAKSKPPALTIHPLEALYKPTATFDAADGDGDVGAFSFGFGAASEDEDEDDAAPVVSTPYRDPMRYRSAAPTPDTAVGKRFFSPGSSAGEDGLVSPTRGLAPPAPKVLWKDAAGVAGGQPLLFLHTDSPFLRGMSVWGRLPAPKLQVKTADETTAEEMTKEAKKKESWMDSRAKEKKSQKQIELRPVDVLGNGGEKWNEVFYEQRGEWNREWKRRRREAAKMKRRRERRG